MVDSAYLGNFRAVVKTTLTDRSKMFVDTRDLSVAPHILLDGVWEEWFSNVLFPYLGNSLFIDVGANYGWFTLLAKSAGARKVLSFEPNPHIFELLIATVAINGMDPSCSYNMALGDVIELGRLLCNKIHPGSSTLLGDTGNRVDVHTDKLDNILIQVFDKEPDLRKAPAVVKIDVEGFEPKVVHGGQQLFSRREPAVTAFVEHHPDPNNEYGFLDMLDFFESNGYVLGLVDHWEKIVKISRADLANVPDAEMICFRRISG